MNPQQPKQHVLTSTAASATSDSTSISSATNSHDSSKKLRLLEPKPRKLAPLLPKPGETSELSSRNKALPRLQPRLQPQRPSQSRSHPSLSGPCGIPQCDQVPCRLVSHRQRVKPLTQKSSKESKSGDSISSLPPSRRPSIRSTSSDSLQSTIAKGAGFPALPWPSSDQSDPVLRQLFHDFFAKLAIRLLKLIVPPFSGYSEWLRTRHQELFEYGTNVKLDCINFVGATHAYVAIRSPLGTAFGDPIGIMIHNDLMKHLRDTLEQYDAERDAEKVLSAIYTLVLEDLSTIESQTGQSSLLGHRAAMERIVASRGGLHNMGVSISLAVSLDRLIAIQVGQPPKYSTWESATLGVQRASLYPAIYGDFFNAPQEQQKLENSIVDFCHEVNRAIEILEGEEWHFDAETKELTSEIFYLYYLRDRVETKFTFLNAKLISENTVDRCVLLAAKIVEYVVLMDDYVASTTLVVAYHLVKLIKQQDVGIMWHDMEDVFQWIVFVLACIPDYFTEKEWALSICVNSLQRSYGRRKWPNGWQGKQLENLMRFVWSADRLDDAFGETCAKLQIMAHEAFEDTTGAKAEVT